MDDKEKLLIHKEVSKINDRLKRIESCLDKLTFCVVCLDDMKLNDITQKVNDREELERAKLELQQDVDKLR